jgi:hypothetical protein
VQEQKRASAPSYRDMDFNTARSFDFGRCETL